MAGALAATVATAAIPLVQRQVIDNVIVTHRQSIWPLAGLLVVAAAVNFCGIYLRRYRGGRLSLDVQHDLRTELFDSLSRLDGARQDEIHTGQLVGRSISDLNMVQGILSMVPVTLGNIVLFALSLGIMVVLSPVLTIVTVAVAPALWVIALASRRKLFPASWDAQQQSGDVAGVVDEAIGGVRVVKGFGQEEQEQERLEEVSERLFASRLRMVRLTARYNPALTAIPSLGMVGVLALGGWLAIHGSITLGTFLAFSAYLAQMTGPVRMFTYLITLGQEARASVIRVFEIIDSRPVITDKPDAIELPPDAAGLSFDDVRFSYVPSEPVLRGLSLRIEPGETVAVVGASGSGKSTLAQLLPRFYDPQDGVVRIGGYDVADLTRDSLRAAIGLVMEDSFLFSDTVRANIAYGRPDATDEQVVAAAQAAQAHEFIVRLPQGYDTMVGEQGLTLSGGQRQRVSLARALVTDPRLLLLDDATSAIDPRLEAEIHAALRSVMRDRTTLIIAHRRSTLNLADRIVVLDQGRVADSGTHEELTERCLLYRQLIVSSDEDDEAVTGPRSIRPRAVRTVEDVLDGRALALASTGASAGAARSGRASHRGAAAPNAGHITGMFASLPPSPELLAQVDELPPAKDRPDVDLARARAGDRHFTLRRLLRPLAFALIIGLVLDGLDAVAGLALPALVRNGIDHGVQTKVFHAIVVVSLVGLAIVLADWLVNIAETMVVGRNGERLLFTLRVKLFAQLQRLGLDFYERELSGRIMTRMTTDVDALSSFLQTGLITMVSSVLTFVGVLAALLIINLRLGLAVLCLFPVLVAATLVFRSKSGRAYAESRERVAAVNADFAENVAGLRVTQAFRREQANRDRFDGLSQAFQVSRLRAQRLIAIYFPFVQTLSTAAGAIVLIIATGQHSGALTTGGLIAYLLYIDMVFSPIQQLSQVFDGYQQAMVGLRRITDLLRLRTSTPPAAAGRRGPAGRPDRAARRGLQLRAQRGERAVRDQPDRRARGDRRPGRPDRRGQVHAGEAHRPVLRRDRRAGAGRRHRRAGLRPGQLPAPARRGPAGVVPVRGHGPGIDRVRQAGRQRRRGRGGRPGDRCARHDHPAARRLRPPGGRAGPQPVGRPAPAHRAGPGPAGRPGHPAARRGHRLARPGRRGRGEPRDHRADRGAHHARGGAPADYRGARGPDRGPGPGRHRRGGEPRRAARRRRHLRLSLGRLHWRIRARRVGWGQAPGPFGIILVGVRSCTGCSTGWCCGGCPRRRRTWARSG